MTSLRKWSWLILGVICGMLLVSGCAAQTKRQWLTFFFDGVPAPRSKSTAPSPEASQTQTTNAPFRRVTPAEPVMVVHPPYAERKCAACHASNYSERLKGDVTSICTSCHKLFLVKATDVHAPVADGQCTICHVSHESKEKFLLVKNSRELCFDCHEPEDVLNIKGCGASEDRLCTACHDPHQENRRFLLHARAGKPSPLRYTTPEK
jgi:predicted CXXCH cytochrome family protein